MAPKVSERAGLTACRFPTGIGVRERPTGVVVFNNLSGTQINTNSVDQI